MNTTIKTKMVMKGLWRILLNGECIGVAEKTNTGWIARPNTSTQLEIRVEGYTKNNVVGEYTKEYIIQIHN